MAEASVIGLGTMGSALARLLLRHGYRVTVWNRTRTKAEALANEGAIPAPDVAAAVRASPIVVVCVYDYAATHAILDTTDVASALPGRVVLQLSTGSPDEARASDAWARARGAELLAGAIQASPSQMGRPDTPILVSGSTTAFQRSQPVLAIFGGRVTYLGDQPAAAPAMDLATLSYVYGSFLGFLHGARVAEVEGFQVDAYGALIAGIAPPFGEFFRHEAGVIQSGDYRVSESPLRISYEAVERIAQHARTSLINTDFPAFASRLLRQGIEAGLADEELAALIKVLRGNAHADRS